MFLKKVYLALSGRFEASLAVTTPCRLQLRCVTAAQQVVLSETHVIAGMQAIGRAFGKSCGWPTGSKFFVLFVPKIHDTLHAPNVKSTGGSDCVKTSSFYCITLRTPHRL
jgi:hypothetical protein